MKHVENTEKLGRNSAGGIGGMLLSLIFNRGSSNLLRRKRRHEFSPHMAREGCNLEKSSRKLGEGSIREKTGERGRVVEEKWR